MDEQQADRPAGTGELLPPPPAPVTKPFVEDEDPEEAAAPPAAPWPERRFWPAVAILAAVGAVIRLYYVLTDDRVLIGGDGFDYHFSALRLADGLGYTSVFVHQGAAAAHHPPAWTALLGAVSWLGARSVQDHQLVGVVLGLALVVLAAMIGRRYFNPRVGLIAALVVAVYPGFWVLEGNLLAEPLALVLLGILLLLVADLRERPTFLRAAIVGLVGGVLALTRPEQVVVVVLIVVPVMLSNRSLAVSQRLARVALAAVAMLALLAPWALYNTQRFEQPVLLTTGDGTALLAANCAPESFNGSQLGFADSSCYQALLAAHPRDSEAHLNSTARGDALDNLRDAAGRWPIVIGARLGRTLAVYSPSDTVAFVAVGMTIDTWIVWAWVGAFWVILGLAVGGLLVARRQEIWTWPLVVPFVMALLAMIAFSGEPRFHAMADLGLIVLAAFAVDRLVSRRVAKPEFGPPRPRSTSGGKSKRPRSARLPSVHVPR